MHPKIATLGLLTMFAFVPFVSHATLIGDFIDVSFTSTEPDGSGSVNVEVTDAVEFVGPGFGLIDGEFLDITGDSIIAAVIEPFDPGGAFYEFTDLDWVGEAGRIIDVTLSLDNIVGLSLTDITFGPDSVRVNATNVNTDEGGTGFLTIGLVTEHDAVSVPEPGSLALLGGGLLGLVLMRRKRTA